MHFHKCMSSYPQVLILRERNTIKAHLASKWYNFIKIWVFLDSKSLLLLGDHRLWWLGIISLMVLLEKVRAKLRRIWKLFEHQGK